MLCRIPAEAGSSLTQVELDWIVEFVFIGETVNVHTSLCVLASLGAAEDLVACLLSHIY